jgi:hypothetical protein
MNVTNVVSENVTVSSSLALESIALDSQVQLEAVRFTELEVVGGGSAVIW